MLSVWGVLKGDYTLAFVLKPFVGPPLAAVIMTWLLEGRAGLHALRQRIKQKRAGRWLYVFALAGIPALLLLGIVIQPGALAGFKGLSAMLLVSYPLTYVAVFFGGGPFGEEIGWRGFALPRMERRYGPLAGTLMLGILWGLWHLPDFLTPEQGGGPGTSLSGFLVNLPVFLLLILAMAVILTWVFNHSKGSIFPAMAAHASVNTPQVVLVPLFASVGVTRLNIAALNLAVTER